jgi:glycosyltransferase A (GT-A) superfamily protein (DUF2064 family)
VLFSRFPESGKTKSRLAASVGPDKAADFHKYSLNAILKLLTEFQDRANIVINYTGCPDATCLKHVLYNIDFNSNIFFSPQPEEPFGNRLNYLFREFGPNAILIPADVPLIECNVIASVLDNLDHYISSIGQTEDKGFYILGMAETTPIFHKIDWQGDVYTQVLTEIQKSLAVLELPSEEMWTLWRIFRLVTSNM